MRVKDFFLNAFFPLAIKVGGVKELSFRVHGLRILAADGSQKLQSHLDWEPMPETL